MINAFTDWLDNDTHFYAFIVAFCLVAYGLYRAFKRFGSRP